MSTLNVSNITDGTNTTSTTNVVKGSAKAWVNFDGTGTVSIRQAHNVSSITDNGTGAYRVNFSSAMPDANYSAIVTTGYIVGIDGNAMANVNTDGGISTTNFVMRTFRLNGALADPTYVFAAVFR